MADHCKFVTESRREHRELDQVKCVGNRLDDRDDPDVVSTGWGACASTGSACKDHFRKIPCDRSSGRSYHGNLSFQGNSPVRRMSTVREKDVYHSDRIG